MAKSRYKPGGERRGFKRLGEGLRASESRIQEQRQIQIDSLKLAALRQKEIDNQFISGLSDKHRFEEGVLREKQELENKARTRKYEAFQKFADTDVARMEGEAKALKEKADYWKEFAPKFADNLSKLAKGIYAGQDRLRGEAQLEDLRKSGVLNKITDQATLANFQLGEHVKQDTYKLDPDQANVLHDKTIKISTHWAAKKVAQWYKENKSLVRSDAIAAWEARGDVKYGYDNALEVQELSARLLLERLGMSPKSEGGREILDMASAMGREDKKKFWDSRQYKLTDERIQGQIATLSSLKLRDNTPGADGKPSDADQFKSGIHILAQQYKNGYHKSGNTITNPYDNPITVADSLEDAKRAYINHNIKTLTREDVEYILAIDIPDTGKGGKIVPFDKKHPVRAESILNDFDEAKAKQHSNLQNVQKQKGLTALNKFKDKVEAYEAKEGQEKGTKPWNEQRLEWINEIMEDSSHTPETRNQALSLIDFDPTNHKVAEVYVDIQRALTDGDTKEAMRLLRGIESSERKRDIQEEIKLLDELNAHGELHQTGQSGIYGVSKHHKNLLQQQEKANPLTGARGAISSSAEKAALHMDSIWLAKYKEARKKDVPIEEAIRLADDHVKVLWNEGEPVGDKPGKGIFARERGDGIKKSNQWIYTHWQDPDSKILADYSKRTITEEEADQGNWSTLTKDTIKSLSTTNPSLISNFEDIDDIIKHPRFINTEQARRLSNQIKRLSQLGDYENIDIDVPEAILVAAANSKYSVTQIVNAVIAAKKEKWTFLKDTPKLLSGSSEAALLNSDKYNKPNSNILPQNENGSNYFNEAFAETGERPMRRQVRAALKEGKTTEQIFSEITGVQIEHTENGFVYSDSEGYLRNGGLDMPLGITPFELIKSSGLMSILYEERLKQDLKKINDKVELPDRLPKGG